MSDVDGADPRHPGLPNTVAPGKRLFHTLIPGFVSIPARSMSPDGRGDTPYMSFGLMGGAMQAQGHAQFLINVLVFGMDLQQAMDAARFRHFAGENVAIEGAVPDSVGLRSHGWATLCRRGSDRRWGDRRRSSDLLAVTERGRIREDGEAVGVGDSCPSAILATHPNLDVRSDTRQAPSRTWVLIRRAASTSYSACGRAE